MNQIRMASTEDSGAQRKSNVKIENPSSEAKVSQIAPKSQSLSSSSSNGKPDGDAVPEDGAAAATTTKHTQEQIKQFKFMIKNIQISNVKSFDTQDLSDPYLKRVQTKVSGRCVPINNA
ncbi:MAG: hypothetical protein EZS28_030262 [Streblomastix strix]|uniref:Uncharacterized protein n=1 Tax=Streblomastix strix TaxID=222440 RepID=A0A5J4UVU7_9EUKA|nr:MAG: hypothetical protein EZS28_030262 [Streblomastix strix]